MVLMFSILLLSFTAHYGSGENQNYLNSGKTHHTSHSESKWSHSASHGYDGKAEHNQENNYHNRKKRQTKGDYDLKKEAACKATKCKFIKCYVGPMRKDEDATIAIRTRINATTLKNVYSNYRNSSRFKFGFILISDFFSTQYYVFNNDGREDNKRSVYRHSIGEGNGKVRNWNQSHCPRITYKA